MLDSQLSPRIRAKRSFENLCQEGEERCKFASAFAKLLVGVITPILIGKPDSGLYVLGFFYPCYGVTDVGFQQQRNFPFWRLPYIWNVSISRMSHELPGPRGSFLVAKVSLGHELNEFLNS